jgi:hypothetical protein
VVVFVTIWRVYHGYLAVAFKLTWDDCVPLPAITFQQKRLRPAFYNLVPWWINGTQLMSWLISLLHV